MKLIIPGKPFAKQRPRFSTKTGATYTPKATVSFENTVRAIAAQTFVEPVQGPVILTIDAYFQMPRSWSRKKKDEHCGGWHTQQPDLDNIIKAIKDGLNRVAFIDDKQVSYVIARKSWTDLAPCTEVDVDRL